MYLWTLVIFICPHILWKLAEGRRMAFLCYKMRDPELDEDLRMKKVQRIFKFYTSYKPKNSTYACLMISFEMLQIFNTFLQFYALDVVLKANF